MTEPMLDLMRYQKWTDETAIYPDAGSGNLNELMYCTLGLCSEAGELANYTKKLYRDGDSTDLRAKIEAELGLNGSRIEIKKLELLIEWFRRKN